jgi:hypothetical protein
VVVIISHPLVNTLIYNLNKKVETNDCHSKIANFTGDSTVFLMLCKALILSSEHLGYLKVPESEEEMTIKKEAIVKGIASNIE